MTRFLQSYRNRIPKVKEILYQIFNFPTIAFCLFSLVFHSFFTQYKTAAEICRLLCADWTKTALFFRFIYP